MLFVGIFAILFPKGPMFCTGVYSPIGSGVYFTVYRRTSGEFLGPS